MGFKRGDVHLVNFNPSKGSEAEMAMIERYMKIILGFEQ
jgi:hypothetical protein